MAYDGHDHAWRTCCDGGCTLVLVYSCVVSFLLQPLLAGQSFCGFEACLQLEKEGTLFTVCIRIEGRHRLRALKLTGDLRLPSNWHTYSVPG